MTRENVVKKRPELAVVMPVYNEEGCIADVVAKWTSELDRLRIDFEIHAYNDGSRDKTGDILAALAARDPRLVVHNQRNRGHGPTIIKGYRENAAADWILQIDSDDEIGPEAFEKLWNERSRYQFLIGRRSAVQAPVTRTLMSSMSRFVVRRCYGSEVYDVNSPYRLMSTQHFRDAFSALPDGMYAPNVVVSGVVSLKKLQAYEVPVHRRPRRTGEVSIRRWKVLKAAGKALVETVSFRLTSGSRLKCQPEIHR